jgi:hypothetical protein
MQESAWIESNFKWIFQKGKSQKYMAVTSLSTEKGLADSSFAAGAGYPFSIAGDDCLPQTRIAPNGREGRSGWPIPKVRCPTPRLRGVGNKVENYCTVTVKVAEPDTPLTVAWTNLLPTVAGAV